MMGSSSREAFTLAQREELERQTLIFKYMVASIPVPPQLLLPLKSNAFIGSTRNLSSSSSDPEPWRCKRTDGKKWRCSRDVAPHQKYCERHSHKNRPRSRKPVEFLSNNNNNNTAAINKPLNSQLRNSSFGISSSITGHESLSHLMTYNTHKEFSSHAVSSPTPRSLDWFMKGEVIALPNSHQQLDWQHQPNGPLSPYGPNQEIQAHQAHQGGCSLLLGMATLEEGHNGNFTDPKASASSSLSLPNKRVPTSSLSLAMFDDDDGRERTMDGGDEFDRRPENRPHWMSPGGPLAEALCLGTTNITKYSTSDRA